MSRKSASFDVLGTCFAFEGAADAIASRLGPKLASIKVDPVSLCFTWFFAGQRDFTYTSMAGSYTPIAHILKHTFKRACYTVGLSRGQVSDDDVAAVMTAVTQLQPRPGLKKCYDGLREAGWDVYGVTNGAKQTSLNYYKLAGIALDDDHLLSCDDVGAAKPDERVYANAHRHLAAQGSDGERWFVAAHAWDLLAAKKAGFKTAYLYVEEHDPAPEVFGDFDLYAEDMDELLNKMTKL